MKIAIIGGAGRMGKWFARLLLKDNFEVIISDKNTAGLHAAEEDTQAVAVSNAEALQEADIILLAVDIDSFEEVVKEIGPQVRPSQVIIDISSIKAIPVELMHRYLQPAVVLGAHPLFGPGAKDLSNQNFVLTPTDERENILAHKVSVYLQKHGARVTLMTPEKHDEMMAVVLGLAHFISIVAADTLVEIGKLSQLKAIGGSTYRVLTTLVESVVSEDPQLYATLQMRLPHLVEVEELFQMKTARWVERVKNQDRQGFIKEMTDLKCRFAKDNSDFGQAYENMYKIMEWL